MAKKTKLDPEHIFLLAHTYERNVVKMPLPRLSQPAFVLAAFSLELYLKCVFVIGSKGQRPPKDHDLEALYDSLPESLRQKIAKYYKESLSNNPILKDVQNTIPNFKYGLRDALKDGKNTFIDWWYLHEAEPKGGFF